MSADRVCDIFEQMQKHYEEFDEIERDLKKLLILEMKTFEGSEKNVKEMIKALKEIEMESDDADESDEDETVSKNNEFRFSCALEVFNIFKMKFNLARKLKVESKANQQDEQLEETIPVIQPSSIQQEQVAAQQPTSPTSQ